LKYLFSSFRRWAAQHSQQSTVWSGVQSNLARAFPNLFDSFTNPNDDQLHLIACVEPPVSLDYVTLITQFYQKHVDSFKTNESQIYTNIEKFVSQNHIKEAERFMRYVIIPHFDSITNLEELLHMLIRTCSTVSIESRDEFCKALIYPISYELTKKKFHKKFAGIFFDFILAILDLNIIDAPPCAYRILEISDFYPWKQLDQQLIHLLQSCVLYDQMTSDSSSREPEKLEKILDIIHQRAKTNVTIYHATHEVALQAILKWSTIINNNTGKPYDSHVFEMGKQMTELVDQQKITSDICIQFIEILQKRIDEPNAISKDDVYFLTVSLFLKTNHLFIIFLVYCQFIITLYRTIENFTNDITSKISFLLFNSI
jgi:hypothetical protein